MKVTDQLGREVEFAELPQRIISLVPSQTELLFSLGLEKEVVGITKFCIHPEEWYRSKERVGGTKQLDLDKISALSPDLIIANKEENTKEDIELLSSRFPVWISDVNTFQDALDMIQAVGQLTGKKQESLALRDRIHDAFLSINDLFQGKSFFYLIWKDPYYVVGKNTFIDAMLSKVGLVNAETRDRYPEFESNAGKVDFIFVSTEPYPFKEEHFNELKSVFQNENIVLIDGEMCSWYGLRMVMAAEYFKELKDLILRSE
jgi:ABC-type Fe3+-hydroxamate transport system substrate-binding protein